MKKNDDGERKTKEKEAVAMLEIHSYIPRPFIIRPPAPLPRTHQDSYEGEEVKDRELLI